MSRPLPALLACALAVGLGPLVAQPSVAAPAGTTGSLGLPPAVTGPALAQDDSVGGSGPLTVSMDSLAPAVLPRRGEVRVTGVVTNDSEEGWADLQVYLLTSADPIGGPDALAEAAASDPAAEIGRRLATEGLFDEIGDLAPGESASYELVVDRADLRISGEPGVYWLGVHVLGAGEGARDLVADGRARTFVPLLPARTDPVRVALMVPLRAPVRRDVDGRLLREGSWRTALGSDGRLERLLSFVASSRRPVTWIADPAVLDAAHSMARDNPRLDTAADGSGPVAAPSPGPSGEPSPSPDGAAGEDPADAALADPPAADPDEPATEPEAFGDLAPSAQDAAGWLARFRLQAQRHEVRALPYGDLDVAAVMHNRLGDLLLRAQRLSEAAAAALGVPTRPVIAPPSGYLSGKAVSRLDRSAPVVVGERAMPDAEGPTLRRRNGVQVALTDLDASAGGPTPDPLSPLAVRQRILAEAALRALDGGGDPLLVMLPNDWDPGPAWRATGFFAGLDLPWVDQVSLASVLASEPGPRDTALPEYPRRERRAHVPFANLVATLELVSTGEAYAELLTYNDSVDEELARSAMLASSYAARRNPARALARVRSTSNQVRLTMGRVVVEGPPFVMMSSTTGPIAVTLVNNLDETVTVALEALTGDELRIALPDPVTLEPGQRSPVRMRADAADIGVRSVVLRPTTVEGVPLGSQVRFNVRSSNVGLVIWVVMGGGAALFLGALALRIRRRVRTRRATPGPLLEGGR